MVPRMLEWVPKQVTCLIISKLLPKSLVPIMVLCIGPRKVFRISDVFIFGTGLNQNHNNQEPKMKIFNSVFITKQVISSLEAG